MCEPVTMAIGTALGASGATAAAIGTAALGSAAMAGLSLYQGEKSRKAQSQAAADSRSLADRQFNAANQKKPNMAAIASDNLQSAGAGVGSTMLTGPRGAGATLGGVAPLGG
jgi:hypothetical protein